MSSLALNEYSPLVNRMKKESGARSYPIWLLVDPKYPVVRYDIWDPILEEIQDRVYRKLHSRIDTGNIFVKNAESDIGIVPHPTNLWAAEVPKEILMLRESILKYQPKIIITFGLITYELIRRVFEIRLEKGPKYWCTTNLEEEFERSIANFDINQTNRIPLLRRVTKNGKLNGADDDFSWEDNDYFRDVGDKIADRIIENKDSLNIWI